MLGLHFYNTECEVLTNDNLISQFKKVSVAIIRSKFYTSVGDLSLLLKNYYTTGFFLKYYHDDDKLHGKIIARAPARGVYRPSEIIFECCRARCSLCDTF